MTVTLPAALALYLDEDRQTHGLVSRSEAVAHAVRALHEKELVEKANGNGRPATLLALRLPGGSPLGLKMKGSAKLARVNGPPIEELLPDPLGPALADEEAEVSAQQQDLAERRALAREVTENGQEIDPY